MKTIWDYSSLAASYVKRPDYADSAIDQIVQKSGITKGGFACDVGAGVAHLTIKLLERNIKVNAVEPNDEMRKFGIQRTKAFTGVTWFEGVGEDTKQEANIFDLVTFGSSFNVVDRIKTLAEVKRIAKNNGWFAALWNHRDLNDPIQQGIEEIICSEVADYNYGLRREDQSEFLSKSGMFSSEIFKIEEPVKHRQSIADAIVAWRSHATLERQAGAKFHSLVDKIQTFLESFNSDTIEVPYTTRCWLAQLA